jgi:hypothetical protein
VGLRDRARRRATARAFDEYAAYVERAPAADGGSWQKLAAAVHGIDEHRHQEALQKLADIHVAACARVGNEHFSGKALDLSFDQSLLETLVKRVGVAPAEVERLIERREHR